MTKTITQTVRFPVSAAELFKTYLDSKRHSAATGARAKISRKTGGRFTAWNGQLEGRNLLIVPNRLVVQTWRSTHWPKSDLNSILILEFRDIAGQGQVSLVHVNVPLHDHKGVSLGWPKYYWEPWRKYFKK